MQSSQDKKARLATAKQELQGELDTAYSNNRALQEKLKEEYQNARQLQNEGTASSRHFRGEVERLQALVKQYENDRQEQEKAVTILQSNVDALHTERDDLRQRLAQVSADKYVAADFETKLENDKFRIDALSAEVATLSLDMEQQKQRHLKVMAGLQQELSESRNESAKPETTITRLKATINTNEINQFSLDEKLIKLQIKLDENEEKQRALESRATEAETYIRDQETKHQAVIRQHNDDMEVVRTEKAGLEGEIEALKEEMAASIAMADVEELERLTNTGEKAIVEAQRQWALNDELLKENEALRAIVDQTDVVAQTTGQDYTSP